MYVVHWPYSSSVEVSNISREKHQKYDWLGLMKTFDIIKDNFKLRKCILGRDHPWPSQWKCKEEFNRRGAEASNSSTLQNQHKLASIVTIGLEFSFEIRGNGGDQLERESSHITNIQSGGRGGLMFQPWIENSIFVDKFFLRITRQPPPSNIKDKPKGIIRKMGVLRQIILKLEPWRTLRKFISGNAYKSIIWFCSVHSTPTHSV